MKRYTPGAAAFLLCALLAFSASAAGILPRILFANSSATPYSYTPLCGGSLPACTYALSTERQLVAGPAATLTGAAVATGALTFASATGTPAVNQILVGTGVTANACWLASGSGLSWTLNTACSGLTVGTETMTTTVPAIQIERSGDSATANIGFTTAGIVDTSAVRAFCMASLSGAISRNCWIARIFEQNNNSNCDVYNSTASAMPLYMVSTAHQGLPWFQRTGAAGSTNYYLDNNGGTLTSLPNPCNALTGGAQSIFFSGNSAYYTHLSNQAGLGETIAATHANGDRFAVAINDPTTANAGIVTCTSGTLLCGGFDFGGAAAQLTGVAANITPTTSNDYISVETAAGGAGAVNLWINGTQVATNVTPPVTLATQARMRWGFGSSPFLGRSETFYASTLTPTDATNLYNNETAFIGSLSLGYQGPGDLFVQTSSSQGLTTGVVQQLQFNGFCYSLRRCYAGYTGPVMNVCQGQGAVTCEDIGFATGTNIIDIATMSAFCGPVSGLNDCAVETWYNQAPPYAGTSNAQNTALDETASTTSTRPTVAFTGCQTTIVTVCVVTGSGHYLTTAGILTIADDNYTISVIAQRTASFTTSQDAFGSSTNHPFDGFQNAANTCLVGASGSTFVANNTTCADSVIHSITMDVQNTGGPDTTLYVDGTASAPSTTTLVSPAASGLGADQNGARPCTCQISEVLEYGASSTTQFAGALGSTGVATLRANQRAAYGF